MLSRVLSCAARVSSRRALSLAIARPLLAPPMPMAIPAAAVAARSVHSARALSGSDRTTRDGEDTRPEALKVTPKLLIFSPREDVEERIRQTIMRRHGRAARVQTGVDAQIFDLFSAKLNSSSVFEVPARRRGATGLALPAESRVDDSVPFSALGLDSLDIVELMVAIERDFHIELEDNEYDNINNVNDIVEKIHGHPRAY